MKKEHTLNNAHGDETGPAKGNGHIISEGEKQKGKGSMINDMLYQAFVDTGIKGVMDAIEQQDRENANERSKYWGLE